MRRLFLCWLALTGVCLAATGSTLKNDLRIRLGQTAGNANSYITDAQMYRALNMAQSYISSIAHPIEKLDTIQGGSYQVSVNSDLILLKESSYLWRNGAILKAIARVSMDSLTKIMGVIDPNKFGLDKFVVAQDGGVVMVAPLTVSVDSILLSYYARGATIDSLTECSLTDEWESVLLDAAKVFVLEKISSVEQGAAIAERDKHIALAFRSGVLRPALGSAGAP